MNTKFLPFSLPDITDIEINEVVEKLKHEKEKHGFDELMICTTPFAQEFKLNEYKMLAKAFELK